MDWRSQGSRLLFAYATNYLIDTDHGVIVDVEATRAIRQAEVGASRTMVERTEERLRVEAGLSCRRHGIWFGGHLAWLVKHKQITPYIPVFDKSTRTDGTFSRSDFAFDAEADCYICPAGKKLVQFPARLRDAANRNCGRRHARYRAAKGIATFANSKRSAARMPWARKIPRDLDEDSRDVARALAGTPRI